MKNERDFIVITILLIFVQSIFLLIGLLIIALSFDNRPVINNSDILITPNNNCVRSFYVPSQRTLFTNSCKPLRLKETNSGYSTSITASTKLLESKVIFRIHYKELGNISLKERIFETTQDNNYSVSFPFESEKGEIVNVTINEIKVENDREYILPVLLIMILPFSLWVIAFVKYLKGNL